MNHSSLSAMAKKLDCPRCQTPVPVDEALTEAQCPSCQFVYKLVRRSDKPATNATVPKPVTNDAVAELKSEVRGPRRLQSSVSPQTESNADSQELLNEHSRRPPRKTPKAGRQGDLPDDERDSPFDFAKSAERVSSISDSELGLKESAKPSIRYRRKRNVWAVLVTLLLAIGSIAGLFGLITYLAKAQQDEFASAKSDDSIEEADDKKAVDLIDQTFEEKKIADSKTATLVEPEPPKVIVPVDDTPVFFTERQSIDAWKKLNGYLVRLEVRTPLETKFISGMIVDSRGWVVTSWSELKDAGEVKVRLAGRQYDSNPSVRDLEDTSRGIIAIDAARDLAVILINRTQVINLSDIKMDPDDDVVPSQRLMMARVPPPGYTRWLGECRISKRAIHTDLNDDEKSEIVKHQLTTDRSVEWILYPPRIETDLSEAVSGSPLVDEQGLVLAMNTGLRTEGNVIAVPSIHIKNLLNTITDQNPDVRPFPRASDVSQPTTLMTPADSAPDGNTVLNSEQQIEKLVKSIKPCINTDWTAENNSEYASLQSLAANLEATQQWFIINPVDADDEAKHLERLDEVMEKITESLEADLDIGEFRSGKGNEHYFDMVTDQSPHFVLFVEVTKDQFNSPKVSGDQSVVFEILGCDKHICMPVRRRASAFRQGRKFLLFGKRIDGRVQMKLFKDEDSLGLVHVFSYVEIGVGSE